MTVQENERIQQQHGRRYGGKTGLSNTKVLQLNKGFSKACQHIRRREFSNSMPLQNNKGL
jgi:hypothetical protein